MCDVSRGGTLVHCASGLIVWIKENIIKTFPLAQAIKQRKKERGESVRHLWWITDSSPSPFTHTAHTCATCFSWDDILYKCKQRAHRAQLMVPVSQLQTAAIFPVWHFRGHKAGWQLKFWLSHESAFYWDSEGGWRAVVLSPRRIIFSSVRGIEGGLPPIQRAAQYCGKLVSCLVCVQS